MSINHPGIQIAASHHLMAVQQWTSACALMLNANLLSCGKWYPCCEKAISEGDFTHALHLLCRWDNAIMSWEGKRQHEALWPCAQQSCERGGKWEDNEENAPGLWEVSMLWLCVVSLDVCARYSWLISWQIGVSNRLQLLDKCQGKKDVYSVFTDISPLFKHTEYCCLFRLRVCLIQWSRRTPVDCTVWNGKHHVVRQSPSVLWRLEAACWPVFNVNRVNISL